MSNSKKTIAKGELIDLIQKCANQEIENYAKYISLNGEDSLRHSQHNVILGTLCVVMSEVQEYF